MKGLLMRRRKEKETISFLIEVLDKMAKNGVIRDDIIEETYWTLKKLLRIGSMKAFFKPSRI